MPTTLPKIHLSTLYYWCNDIAATKHFHADLIGLEETYYDEQAGWFTCQSNDLNIVFMRASTPLPTFAEWAKQPGYRGGTGEVHSWVITVPAPEFQAIVARLKAAGVPCLNDTPLAPRPDKRQVFVHETMGNTGGE